VLCAMRNLMSEHNRTEKLTRKRKRGETTDKTRHHLENEKKREGRRIPESPVSQHDKQWEANVTEEEQAGEDKKEEG